MVCEVKEQQRKKKIKECYVCKWELQNVSQCAEQLLCLSLRNAVALAVIHWIAQDPAWTVWESHPAANSWEGKGGGNQHEKHTKYKH